jgi:hypothetical protein
VKIMVEKMVHEVSLTTEGGRPGSSIIEFGFSPTSMLPAGSQLHVKPVCKSYVVIPGGDMDSIPQYIRANLKNFNISLDKGNSLKEGGNLSTEPLKVSNTHSEMAAPAPTNQGPPGNTAAAAPSGTTTIATTAAPPPVLPGSEASSAYLQTIQNQHTQITELQKENERLKKAEEQLNAHKKKESETFRTELANTYHEYNDGMIMAIETSDEVKADPELQKRVADLKRGAEESHKIFKDELVPKMDDATAVSDGETVLKNNDMITFMKNNVQLVQAFNKIGAKRRQLDIHALQMAEIERAKAGTTAAATSAATTIAPPATTTAPPTTGAPQTVNNIAPVGGKHFDKMAFLKSLKEEKK